MNTLQNMSRKQLLEIAKQKEIKIPAKANKEDIIALITEKQTPEVAGEQFPGEYN